MAGPELCGTVLNAQEIESKDTVGHVVVLLEVVMAIPG